MSNQPHSSSQYPQQGQHLVPQVMPNSQVQGPLLGFNSQQTTHASHPFNGPPGNHPSSAMSQFTPIQPSAVPGQVAAWNHHAMASQQHHSNNNHNNMHGSAAAAAYHIPANWIGGQQMAMSFQHQGHQAIPAQGAGANMASSPSKKKRKSGSTPIPDLAASGSSLVPPDLDMKNPKESRASKRRSSIGSLSNTEGSMENSTSPSNKMDHNRERNREHARTTRMRKKAYVQKLKEMADGLRAIQTDEIRQRRLAVHQMNEMQKTRKRLIQKFLHCHANYEEDPHEWSLMVENNFWLKQPVTPFRSFRRSEVERDCRMVRGIEAVICDSASIATMIQRTGCRNARWQRIKRRQFERCLESSRIHLSHIDENQRVESSLSSSSSTDSSYGSGSPTNDLGLISPPTAIQTTNAASDVKKVSSSSGGENSINHKRKRNEETTETERSEGHISTSSETEVEPAQKAVKTSGLPSNIARSGGIVHNVTPVMNVIPSSKVRTGVKPQKSSHMPRPGPFTSVQLKEKNTQEIGASYAINEDDMIMIDDVLMCPFVYRTRNAVHCGALADCVMPGMIRANFSKQNKLQNMEIVYDAMGFMQQLDGSNGGQVTAQVIPGSLEMALMSSPDEARVITEARPPFSVVHVNESWTRLTKYTQLETEGRPLLELLEGERTDPSAKIRPGKPKHMLEEVAKGRSACSTNLHYDKSGATFVDFMCSYPLTNSDDEISHLLHVNMKLSAEHALI